MSDIVSLVYVSTASESFSEPAMAELMRQSRGRNQREGITGVLLYADGNFMQYLEGEEAAVSAVYASIVRDRRHHGLIELLHEPVPERVFSEWSMGLRSSMRLMPTRIGEVDTMLDRRLDERARARTAADLLLSSFWQRNWPRRPR